MNFKEWLDKKDLEPIVHKRYGIMSAEVDDDKHHDTLKSILSGTDKLSGYSGNTYDYYEAEGMWKKKEKSLLIPDIEFKDIYFLSKHFHQESFIHKKNTKAKATMYFLSGEYKGLAFSSKEMLFNDKGNYPLVIGKVGMWLDFDWDNGKLYYGKAL